MTWPAVIAIDGTASSGKSTLGLRLARRLAYLFFDTGVLYRAVTWAACEQNILASDGRGLERVAAELKVDVQMPAVDDGRTATVLADGRDVTWAIRSKAVDQAVSRVSAYPGVRRALLAEQRAIGARGGVIMVGRDIGTVVLPDADLKLFVDAAVEERARRRHAECLQRGIALSYEEVLADLRARDRSDREKPISPMVPAADAVVVDTTHMSADRVVEWVLDLIKTRAAQHRPRE